MAIYYSDISEAAKAPYGSTVLIPDGNRPIKIRQARVTVEPMAIAKSGGGRRSGNRLSLREAQSLLEDDGQVVDPIDLILPSTPRSVNSFAMFYNRSH